MSPKITIITVCFNSVKTIEDTINSVANQTYHNIEHIVIDGGSRDGTLQILKNYQKNINTLISEPDDGLYYALNKGIRIATGEIVAILHSDDYFCDKRVIEDVLLQFQNNTELEVIIANLQVVRGIKPQVIRKISSYNFKPWQLILGVMPAHCATFVKKEVYNQYGDFNTRYQIAADFDFFVRIFINNHVKYKTLDRMSISMRAGGLSSRGIKSYILISKEIQHIIKHSTFGWLRYLSIFRFLWKILELRLIKKKSRTVN